MTDLVLIVLKSRNNIQPINKNNFERFFLNDFEKI